MLECELQGAEVFGVFVSGLQLGILNMPFGLSFCLPHALLVKAHAKISDHKGHCLGTPLIMWQLATSVP